MADIQLFTARMVKIRDIARRIAPKVMGFEIPKNGSPDGRMVPVKWPTPKMSGMAIKPNSEG